MLQKPLSIEESSKLKAIRRQRKKRPRMKITGASVKKLSRLIKAKAAKS